MNTNPEKEPVVLVSSNSQLTLAYPELFEDCKDPNIFPFQFQMENKKDGVDYSQEPRLLLLPSGIVSIACPKDNDYVWGDYSNQEYTELLTQLNELIGEKNSRPQDIKDDFVNKTIDHRDFAIKFFPFNNVPSSQELITTMEKKLLAYKHKAVEK